MFKNLAFSIIIIVIIFAAIFLTSDSGFIAADKSTEISTHYEFKKTFSPDIVLITLGVETENADLESAFAENNKKMNKIQNALSNIKDIKIETLNFQVSPQKKRIEQEDVIYYQVRNILQVESKKMDEISKIIETSIEAGANSIQTLNYSLENRDNVTKEVISEAIKNTEEKIEFIAQEMGKKKYEIISLNIDNRIQDGNNTYLARNMAGLGEAAMPSITVPDINITVLINTVFTVK